jgi:hypothetical protein
LRAGDATDPWKTAGVVENRRLVTAFPLPATCLGGTGSAGARVGVPGDQGRISGIPNALYPTRNMQENAQCNEHDQCRNEAVLGKILTSIFPYERISNHW